MTEMLLNINNTVIKVDTPNANGRTYPLREVVREAEKIQSLIDGQSTLLGGNGDNSIYTHDISMDMNTTHTIEKVWMEGDELKAEIKLLDTPEGIKIKESIEAGVKFKLIPRGTAIVNNNGMVSDYDLITIDIIREENAS